MRSGKRELRLRLCVWLFPGGRDEPFPHAPVGDGEGGSAVGVDALERLDTVVVDRIPLLAGLEDVEDFQEEVLLTFLEAADRAYMGAAGVFREVVRSAEAGKNLEEQLKLLIGPQIALCRGRAARNPIRVCCLRGGVLA